MSKETHLAFLLPWGFSWEERIWRPVGQADHADRGVVSRALRGIGGPGGPLAETALLSMYAAFCRIHSHATSRQRVDEANIRLLNPSTDEPRALKLTELLSYVWSTSCFAEALGRTRWCRIHTDGLSTWMFAALRRNPVLPLCLPMIRRLKSPHLFGAIDRLPALGRPVGNKTFEVVNPSTGEVLAELPDMGVEETRAAVDKAYVAQSGWAALTARERSDVLWRWHQLIIDHAGDLAAILTAEMGKPLAEAMSEVSHAAAYLQWYAEEANRVYGETISAPSTDRRMLVIKQPIGVVGTITPWNFPASMVARKISPALAAGCTIVLKPAEQTPLVAGAMFALAHQAGFPDGVVNLIYASEGDRVGRELCTNSKIRKISFTGSTEVGRLLMRQCSDQIKKVSLELGGNAPFIIFDDADIDAAVDGAIQAKFRNAGQTCVSANRIYVQSSVHDEFVKKFVEKVRHLSVGDGFDAGVDIGPLIDRHALAKIESHIADAIAKGGTIRCGGQRIGKNGTFFKPTVLTEISSVMAVAQEETFGPLAPIIRFNDADQVVREANDTIYGLAAYFYASNMKRVWRVAEALEYGMVGINTGRMSSEAAPFGGMKQSGIGREGSRHGLEDYLEMKYLCMGGI